LPHHHSGVPFPLPRRIRRVRLSIASPSVLPSPFCRRVGIRISTFEACSGFTRVTARRIAQPPKAAFVTRLRSSQLPAKPLVSYQSNRQFPGWNPPPLATRALGAHCKNQDFRTNCGPLISLRILGAEVWCKIRPHREAGRIILPDLTVPSLGPRMVCTKCGTIGADVRPQCRHRVILNVDSNIEGEIMRKFAVMAASSTALFAVALNLPNQTEAMTFVRPAGAAAIFDGIAKSEQVRWCRTRGCWGRY
jgi:hypothetical protein